MDTLQFIILPIVGAIIGAITNDLAIRMLFRPYKKKYFFKIPLPLTPGIVPRQQKNISQNIAITFEKHLLSTKDLMQFLTNKKAQEIIVQKVNTIFANLGPLVSFAEGFKPDIIKHINEAIRALIESDDIKKEIDIRKKIEDKINSMDIKTLENLILGFSRKQFRHITLFGALLGALIGLTQAILINCL